MTDLVERLRNPEVRIFVSMPADQQILRLIKHLTDLCAEAANEIERLRKPTDSLANQYLSNSLDQAIQDELDHPPRSISE